MAISQLELYTVYAKNLKLNKDNQLEVRELGWINDIQSYTFSIDGVEGEYTGEFILQISEGTNGLRFLKPNEVGIIQVKEYII